MVHLVQSALSPTATRVFVDQKGGPKVVHWTKMDQSGPVIYVESVKSI